MISGALLIDYSDHYSTKTFLKKRVRKTLIPYIAWCLIGIGYLIFYNVLSVDELSIKTVVRMILNDEVLDPYWFLPAILSAYLLTPLLSSVQEDKRKKTFECIIASMFVLNFAAPFFLSQLGLGGLEIQMPLTMACLYYITGYYIDKYLNPQKYKTVYLLALLGLLIMLIGTITASYRIGSLVKIFMGYQNFPCYLFSAGVFCAFKEFANPAFSRGGLSRITALFVNETFGIYLIHWYVLNEIKIRFALNYADFMYRIPLGIVAFIISWLIVKVLRMIPVVKNIVP